MAFVTQRFPVESVWKYFGNRATLNCDQWTEKWAARHALRVSDDWCHNGKKTFIIACRSKQNLLGLWLPIYLAPCRYVDLTHKCKVRWKMWLCANWGRHKMIWRYWTEEKKKEKWMCLDFFRALHIRRTSVLYTWVNPPTCAVCRGRVHLHHYPHFNTQSATNPPATAPPANFKMKYYLMLAVVLF